MKGTRQLVTFMRKINCRKTTPVPYLTKQGDQDSKKDTVMHQPQRTRRAIDIHNAFIR